MQCPKCNGSGEYPIEKMYIPCLVCGGTGKNPTQKDIEALRLNILDLEVELKDLVKKIWDKIKDTES